MQKPRKSFRYCNSLLIFLLSVLINVPVFPQYRADYIWTSPATENLVFNKKPSPVVPPPEILLSSVGGVFFDQTALPGAGLSISNLTIDYNPINPDGQRLVLNINGNNIASALYDWMLLPIARFADSQNYPCFTYFGKLLDKDLEETILTNGGKVFNYHPYLLNNLLGVRIADMDLLMMYRFTPVLPLTNGSFVLGAGESLPDTIANKTGYNNFLSNITSVENNLQQTFRSYLITDYNLNITFSVNNGQLSITGDPFYYCWRYNSDNPSYSNAQVESNIISTYNTALNNALIINPSFNPRDLYIDSLLSAAIRYDGNLNLYTAGTFLDLVKLDQTGNTRRNFLEQYYTNDLYSMLISVEVDMVAYGIEYLKELSEGISRPDLIVQANPEVWNATRMLMKYAAFFRFIKEEYPGQWTGFIDRVKNLKGTPTAITPTAMYPKGNIVIENALNDYFNANMPAVDAGENLFNGECKNDINLNPTGSGIYLTWKWAPDDGSLSDINIQNPAISVPNTGETIYTVTVTDIKGRTSTDNKSVTFAAAPEVIAPPDVSITENIFPYTLNTLSAGTGLNFSWLPDNGSLNNIQTQSPQITHPKGGNTEYIVKVTDSYGCTASDTVIVFVDQALYASDASDENDLKIYPNPFIDYLRIDNAENILRIEIYDEAGRLILSQANSNESMIVKTNNLSPGKYLVFIFTNNKKVYGRHIIKV